VIPFYAHIGLNVNVKLFESCHAFRVHPFGNV
jgi:hypothetical protein